MSYCRWSSEGFKCDVYVYEDCDGSWTTHVAERRYVDYEKDKENLVTIGLSEDGKTFKDSTPLKCAETLEWLRGLGYIVPQYAIDELREEEKERG